MSAFKNLKNTIAANIRANGNGEITGQILQESLINIINELGNGMQFFGIANPTTNPGQPDNPRFYIATNSGEYSNFLNSDNTPLTLEKDSIYILSFENGYWESQNIAENIGGSASPELETKIQELESKLNELTEQILIDKYTYGIRILGGSVLKRIGNLELHKALPVQTQIGPTFLADDGTNVLEQMGIKALSEAELASDLQDAEGSFEDLLGMPFDGSLGQVMTYIPDFYIRHSEYNDPIYGLCNDILISTVEIPGFTYIPHFYIGSYEATINRETNTLSSVKSSDPVYRGGDNTSDWDDTYRSLIGKPASNLPESNLRDLVRKRNATSYNWNIMTYDAQKILFWLIAIEYATLDVQQEFIKELTAEGYHQGGLGGMNTLNGSWWSSYNNYNPIFPIGLTDKLNYQSGEVSYQAPTESGVSIDILKATRYRSIENPFGHLYKQIDGLICMPAGGVSYTPYIFKNREYYSDNTDNENNIYSPGMIIITGNSTSQEISNIILGKRLDILPCEGDYSYPARIETFIQDKAPAYMGGALFSGNFAGMLCIRMGSNSISNRNYAGTRICYMPNDINWNWEEN